MKVIYAREAYEKAQALVRATDKEVGWVGIGDPIRGKYGRIMAVYVEEIIVPPQEVTSATVDLDDEALAKMCELLVNEERSEELSRVVYWGHSHVNMDVSPSGVDKRAWSDWMVGADQTRILATAIFNKSGESYHEVRIYNPELGDVSFEDVPGEIASSQDWSEWAAEQIKKFLTERRPKVSKLTHNYKPSKWSSALLSSESVDDDDDLTLKEWRTRYLRRGYDF